MTILFAGNLIADYHQIYLSDVASAPGRPELWTDENIARRMVVAHGVVVMMTARNMTIPVVLSLLAGPADFSDSRADMIVTGSIDT